MVPFSTFPHAQPFKVWCEDEISLLASYNSHLNLTPTYRFSCYPFGPTLCVELLDNMGSKDVISTPKPKGNST